MNTAPKSNPVVVAAEAHGHGRRASAPPRQLPPLSTGRLVASGRERSVPLRGQFTKATASCCIARMLVLAAEDPRQPIITYVNSSAGIISEALAVISTMNGIRCPILTVCSGVVGGPAIAVAAHGWRGFRVALPTARFSFAGLDAAAQGRRFTGYESLLAMFAETVAQDTGKQPAEILQWLKRGVEFSAQEALRYGLIDLISTKPVLPDQT